MSQYKPYPAYEDSEVDWIGGVPSHWDVAPLFAVASERNEPNRGMIEDNLLSLSYGAIVQKDINTNDGLLPESFETYQIVRPGDTVFRLTDLQNDKRSLRTAIVGELGIITSAYVAVSPRSIQPRYFSYLLRSYDVQKVFYSMGGGMRQSMKFEDLRRMPVLAPSKDEQSVICKALDRETTRIDALVSKKTLFIELLREKRQALISHAVTKGLDPNVMMKDSGVEWLGKMPEHWNNTPIKHVLNGLVDTEHKTVDFYDDGDYLVVRTTNIKNGQLVLNGAKYTDFNGFSDWTRRGIPQPGDILFTREAPAGEACLVPPDVNLCVGQRTVLMRTIHSKIVPKFCLWSLYGGLAAEFIDILSQGSTVAHFNMGDIGSIPILLPPLVEQEAISAHLDYETTRIDTLITTTERSIELLKERRCALITAAVTGQIDLRETA